MSSLGELFFSLGLDSKEFDKAIDEAKKKVAELDSGSKIKLQLDVEHLKSQIQEATKSISANGVSINTKVNTERIENLRRLLEESKQQAKELEAAIANASTPPSIKAMKQRELQDVTKRIAEQEARLQSKTGTSVAAPPVPVRTVLDAESVNIVKAQLAKLGEPITAKISVEYDLEKFQAVETAMKNFGSRINQAINAGLPQGSIPKPSKTVERKGVAGWLDKVSETLFGDSADGGGYSTPAASAANISQVSSALGTLSKEIEALGNATEKISKRANGKKSVVSDEEAEMRKYYSQLQRLEEGVRRWQNVKAKIESSKIDKSSDNYKNAIRLIDAYIEKLIEAQKQAGKFTNRELTGMLGQTASGEIAKTGRLVAQQKSDEQTIRNNLVKEQAQIQRLEEGVRRIQNVIAKLNATDVDKSGSGYKQAISLLNGYIDKLNTAKRLAGSFSKREMAGMLGQTMSGEIAEAERLVADQKKVEQSKKKTAKSVAQAEKEELQLKREKIKLQKEEANLGKARANQKKAELQKDKEAVRLKKERVSLQKKLGKAAGNVGNWASQLGNQLGNYISIYTIERFVRNLYTIGGEFQKQQIALRNMLGDVDKGNAIFERMKGLAVKSPFTFSELASYTKQMSAYGIEYENLYDTTKRLADISAGVGVDMGRLILAFGQVRSAAVLRGQELRQFTEAGIPLVNELAKKFSELEHRAVSTGEVFEKISKREVSFGMVKDILFDMTDPGGKFFQTQEQLAESLAGKWSNLKDAWSIMMADIANGHNTTLKGLAETLTWIIGHWEKFAPLVMGTVVALGAYRSIMTLLIPLQAAFFAATNIAPWVAIATILGGVTIAVTGYIDEAETALELSERLNTAAQKAESENTDKLNTASRYLDILKQQASVEEDKYALYQKQLKTFEELVKLYPKQMEGIEFEKLTLQEIENIRKRIAEQAKNDILAGYDKSIKDALLAYTLERQRMAVKANVAGLTIDDYSKEEKKNLTDLYNVYTGLMNAKEEYEQSLLDKNKPATLKNWQEVAKKMADEYAKSKIYFKDPAAEHDIYAYFDHLEEVFKDAKSKYERATDESLRKPQKAIMNAANAINMAIGGRNLNYKEIDKSGKDAAKRDAKAYLDALKDELRKIGSQWDLYKELFEATGDKNLSMKIAFDGQTPAFDSYIEHLKGKMDEEIKKRGLGISVSDLLEMGKKGIADKVNDKTATAWTEGVAKNLNALIDAYNDANNKLRKESIDTFLEIIKNSKDFAQQIADVERQLQKELKVLEETYGTDSEEYNRRSKEAINRAEEKKSSINLEKFKKESNWVNVFSNLEDVPLDVIDDMIDKIEKLKAESTGMKFNELKELAEALKRLRSEMLDRNPFKLIGDAIETLSADPKSEEAWSNLFKGINRAIQLTKEMASSFSDAFKAMGVTVTEEGRKVMDGLESLGRGLAEALVGYKTKDYTKVIGGLVQSASGMANIMSGLFSNNAEKTEYRQYLLDIIKLQTEYNSALIDTKLLNEDVWGNTKIQDSINAVEALSQAVQYYNELVDKEVEAHVDPSGGFWKNFGKANYWNPLGWWSLGVDSLANSNQELVKIKDNLRYITQTPSMFRHTKTTNLVDWLKEEGWGDLFDKDGRLNLDLATSIKDWDRLTGETKEYLNNLIEAEEAIRKSEEALDDYLSETFGDLGNQLSDSIVDAFRNGTDAAEGFKDSVVAVLEDVGAQMMRNVFLTEVFSEYEKDLKQIYGDYANHQDEKKFTEDLSSATKDFVDDTKDSIEAGTSWLEQYKKLMKEQGFDVFAPEKSEDNLSKGIQSITEDTGGLLASYVNAMRADVSVNRTLFEQLVNDSVPRMSVLAEAQLMQLQMIVSNTSKNVVLVGEIRDLVNRVIDRGSGKLKVG